MAIVKRENRQLTVHEDVLHTYLFEGYDQIDSEGNIIKRATGGRNVTLAEHNKAIDEIERLKAELQAARDEAKMLEADNERLTKQVRGQQPNKQNNR
jgi:predicted nuclease with TOPRIM domain